MTDEELVIVEAMIVYGGGFVSALGRAWRLADVWNQAKLKEAFLEYWQQYRDLAAIKKAKQG
jgi:hypothetical protein